MLPGTNPDPTVCRGHDAFYLVTSSFSYFPGLPIYRSENLQDWALVGHGLTRRSQLDFEPYGGRNAVFAPTIRYNRGRYYLVSTDVGGAGNFLITAEHPAGPWSDPIYIDKRLFDPSLLFDGDAVYYTRRGPTGIDQAELDVETGRFLCEPREIARGYCSRDAEGPHLYHIGGYYYLLIAEGGSRYGHMATVGRSRSPWGPFEGSPYNPLITQRHVTFSPIRDTGHAELVQDDAGGWWLFCLGTRNFTYGSFAPLGRETFLAPVVWTDEGWPVVTGDLPGVGGTIPTDANAVARALDPHDGRRIFPTIPWDPTTTAQNPSESTEPDVSSRGRFIDRCNDPSWTSELSGWYRHKTTDNGFFAVEHDGDLLRLLLRPVFSSDGGRREKAIPEPSEVSLEGTAMLLRPQTALFCDVFVDVDLAPRPEPVGPKAAGPAPEPLGSASAPATALNAGLILFLDESHYCTVTVSATRSPDQPADEPVTLSAAATRHIGDLVDRTRAALRQSLVHGDAIRLLVRATDRRYDFWVGAPTARTGADTANGTDRVRQSAAGAQGGESARAPAPPAAPTLLKDPMHLGSIESRFLSPELAESWTGVFWGPVAFSAAPDDPSPTERAVSRSAPASPAARFARVGEMVHPQEAHWWRITGDIPTRIQ